MKTIAMPLLLMSLGATAAPKFQEPAYGPDTTPFSFGVFSARLYTDQTTSWRLTLGGALLPYYCDGSNVVITQIQAVGTTFWKTETPFRIGVNLDLLGGNGGGDFSFTDVRREEIKVGAEATQYLYTLDTHAVLDVAGLQTSSVSAILNNAVESGSSFDWAVSFSFRGYCAAPL